MCNHNISTSLPFSGIYKFININISLCVPCAHSQICSGITFSRLLCARERADKLLAHKPCAMKLIRRQLFAPLDAKSDIVSLLYVIEDTSNGVQVHIQRDRCKTRENITRVCCEKQRSLSIGLLQKSGFICTDPASKSFAMMY